MEGTLTTHPYQVRSWFPEEPALKIFGQAHWAETCRCQTKERAERIAKALIAVGYGPIMAVVKLSEEHAPEYLACFPSKEAVEQATGEMIHG
jgi:hypothetical protein